MSAKRIFITFFVSLFFFITALSGQTLCHAGLTLEGQFMENGKQLKAEQPLNMTVRIYDDEFGGKLLFEEKQDIVTGSEKAVFSFEQGKVTVRQKTPELDAATLWVEVESDGQVLSPRLALSSIDTVNDLEGDSISLRSATLRTGGTAATLLIDNNGVTLSNLLNMGSQSINLGGVERNTWPTGSGSSTDADLLDGHDSTYFMPAATDNWVNTTGDTMSGALTVNGHLYANVSLSVGTDNGTIYFGNGSQYFNWNNSKNKFHLTNDLSLQGTLQAGSPSIIPSTSYNRFGIGTASHTLSGQLTSSSDLLISDDLEVNGIIYADDTIYAASNILAHGNYLYDTPKTFNYHIQPADFVADAGSHYMAIIKTATFTGTQLFFAGIKDSSDEHLIIYAPLHIPDGATITKLRLYYSFSGDSFFHATIYDYISMYLYRDKKDANAIESIGYCSIGDPNIEGNHYIETTCSNVTSSTYQYFVKVSLHSKSKGIYYIRGCDITYSVYKVTD